MPGDHARLLPRPGAPTRSRATVPGRG